MSAVKEYVEQAKEHAQKKEWYHALLLFERGVGAADGDEDLCVLCERVFRNIKYHVPARMLMKRISMTVDAFQDKKHAQEILAETEELIKKTGESEYELFKLEQAKVHIEMGQMETAEETLFSLAVPEIDDAERCKKYYYILALFYQQKKDYETWYEMLSHYIGYLSEGEISKDLVYEWTVSALVCKNVYNFSVIAEHPSMRVVEGTLLFDVLKMLQRGKKEVFKKHREFFENDERLRNIETMIAEKLNVTMFVRMSFECKESLPIRQIAQCLDIGEDAAVLFIFKALALGLVDGKIDLVEHVFFPTYIEPSVLSIDEIKALMSTIKKLKENTVKTIATLEKSEYIC